MRTPIACAFVAVSFSFSALSAEVIVNPSTKIGADDVRDVYVGEMTAVNGVVLQPLDNAYLLEKFTATLLKIDVAKYRGLWTKKAFRDGLTAPPTKKGDADVIEFVKRTPGAIGYIDGVAPAGVNVILKF